MRGPHGVDPIGFGILVVKLLEIGMITPAVGLDGFVIHPVAKDHVRLEQISARILPFLIADVVLVALMLVTRGMF